MMIVILGGGRRREMCLMIEEGIENLRSVREAIENIANAMGTTFDSVAAAFEYIGSCVPFSVDEIKNYVMALEERIKFEDSVCHDDEYEQECNWPPNHCKCKAGHSSKPIIKPSYWYRIRSFCVRNKYH